MYCKECGNKFKNEKAIVCVHCGTNKGQGNNYCSECGTEVKNKDGAEVCLNCGCKLNNSKINISNSLKVSKGIGKPIGNSKLVAGISAILLGAIGIHNFYLDYKEKGFIQLSIFLVAVFIFGLIVLVNNILSIVDAVNIFRGFKSDSMW